MIEQTDTSQEINKETSTRWHDYFSGIFKEALIPLNLEVESDYAVGKSPPKVDVLIIRRKGAKWTKKQLQYLPDGVRQSNASHIILELKKTESISVRSIWQAMGYLNGYLNLKNLNKKDVRVFLISSKTPLKKTLNNLEFTASKTAGVYNSKSIITGELKLICANELSEAEHNVWIKLFASKQKQKSAALRTLLSHNYQKLGNELKTLLLSIITYWNQTGEYLMEKMKQDLSDKSYLKIDPAGIREFVKTFFPAEEVVKSYRPEEIIRNYSPKEIISNYSPKEIFKNFDRKTIEAYLNSID